MSKEIKFDSIVICSTLNQMVNYIAIKEHDIKNIYNIRLEEENNKFNYNKWDENLEKVLDRKINDVIKYSEDEITSHEEIIDKLLGEFGSNNPKSQFYPPKREKILWNITGGQRHFVMAITEYVYNERPQDVIVYFEGDNEKMYYYNKNNEFKENDIYIKEEYTMTVPIALRLMGFDISGRESYEETSKYYNFLRAGNEEQFSKNYELRNEEKIEDKKPKEEYKQLEKELNWYERFYNMYCNSEILRRLLTNSNRFKGEEEIRVFDKIKEDIDEHIKNSLIIDNENIFNDEGVKILEASIISHTNAKVFGYILERMTLYKILSILKQNKNLLSKIADIDISVKIKDKTNDKDEKLGLIDEFDILLVTKKGKVIMFECKSGGMSGDNAKSHNYSTYAISGVYGTPRLICPIKEDDVRKKVEFDTKAKNQSGKKECKKNEDVYEYIRSARNAAEKANLSICYIDEIYDVLEEIKKLINVREED